VVSRFLVNPLSEECSGQEILDDVTVNVGEAEFASLEAVSQLLVVDAEEVQNSGVEVMHVDRILGGGIT
jgi:hypothetical protein